MNRPIGLDFLGEEGGRRLGLAVLAAGALAAALAGWRFASLHAEIESLTRRVEAAPMRAPAAVGLKRVASADPAADLRRAQAVLDGLSTPWNDLFAEIERAVGPRVALLGIQPEAASGRVTIQAEAKSLGEALDFAERLGRGTLLGDPFLSSHEVRTQDPNRPVRFTLVARWRAAPGPQ